MLQIHYAAVAAVEMASLGLQCGPSAKKYNSDESLANAHFGRQLALGLQIGLLAAVRTA